jgi:hypothetical protein
MTDILIDRAPATIARLLLAHGAGAPMDSPFMNAMSALLVARRITVLRFEFPYMAARRTGGTKRPAPKAETLVDSLRAAIDRAPESGPLLIGGKSMGGRVASLVAGEAYAEKRITGLVCLGYPFHPPNQPRKLRTAHLVDLQCPSLIVQGERDPFGPRAEVEAMTLSKAITFAWCPDGDHDFGPRGNSGFKRKDNLALAADAVATFATERSIT